MDETIAKWIIEFLLRRIIDDKIISGVISTLPLVNNDNRLKKTLLLRRIESEASNGCVSEKLLDFIEIIEALDHERGDIASNLMREAFCMVAVDCTARFLEENAEENGRYVEAIERVWKSRACKAVGLESEAARRWLEDLEMAVKDGGVCEKIWMRNTRNEALRAVKRWLKEAWDALGPPVLEVLAAKAGNEVEELRRNGGGGGGESVVRDSNPCRELVVFEGKQKEQAPLSQTHVAGKTRRHRGVKISEADDEVMNKAVDSTTEVETKDAVAKVNAPAKVNGVEEVNGPSSMDPPAMGDSISDDLQIVQPLSFRRPVGNNVILEDKQNGPEELESPEVANVQKALKHSRRELHAAVTDPLPDALRTAQILLSAMAANNFETAAQNQSGLCAHPISETDEVQEAQGMAHKTRSNDTSNEAILPKPVGQEMHATSEQNKDVTENVENQDTLRDATQEPRRQGRKRSLMEPDGTSHTFEWDDSIENSSGSPVHPGLHSPRLRRASPLKLAEDKIFQRRRERRRWTVLEEDTLREAVRKFGKGNWVMIKNIYSETFLHRSDVDLKDKWRNMAKFPPC